MATFEAKSASLAPPRPLSAPPRKPDTLELLTRAAITQAFAHARGMPIEKARAIIAKRHSRYDDEASKIVCRAATSPAMTFEEGWAQEFVVLLGAGWVAGVMPKSAFAQLAALGMHLVFERADVMVPDFVPTPAGTFVRQGDAIPVIQGQTTGQMLTRKKLACIVAYTGELDESAIVPLEGLLRTRIQESTTLALDSVLLDDQPASDVRPAGLLNGGAQVTSTGGLQSDLQALGEGLFAAANRHIRAPALILNTAQAIAARLQIDREFMPLVVSPSIEPGTVVMLDAADFACASQTPRFEISRDATVHFEDTDPQHVSNGGVASPVRSLWQEELLGLRLIMEVDWVLRRPGVACFMQNVHWVLGGH